MVYVTKPRPFAFVHVYRTGGTSVQQALIQHEELTIGYKRLPHQSILEAIREKPEMQRALKVAIIRDPWTWLVSQYHFVNDARYSKGRHDWYGKTRGFEDFVFRYKSDYPYRYRVQADFVCDGDARVLVDRLYPFERIDQFWLDMADYLGVQIPPIHLLRATPPGVDVDGYYTGPLRTFVRDAFAQDFELHRGAQRSGETHSIPR
jgi:hypothetical protein